MECQKNINENKLKTPKNTVKLRKQQKTIQKYSKNQECFIISTGKILKLQKIQEN